MQQTSSLVVANGKYSNNTQRTSNQHEIQDTKLSLRRSIININVVRPGFYSLLHGISLFFSYVNQTAPACLESEQNTSLRLCLIEL